uniref:Secreted protein n=1 Tax=Rhipicephalus microplus TaxID=6941 RepID=A0A6M2DCH3_RHIMP
MAVVHKTVRHIFILALMSGSSSVQWVVSSMSCCMEGRVSWAFLTITARLDSCTGHSQRTCSVVVGALHVIAVGCQSILSAIYLVKDRDCIEALCL